MEQCWRWFGPDDPVPLAHIRQAGASGIVSALHHLNDGRAWPADEIAKRQAEVAAAGLPWRVVESLIVHEEIKTRTGDFRAKIDAFKQSLCALGDAGLEIVCTNFMAITDWTRTDLEWLLPHGGTALRFDVVELCAYDMFMLKRPGAEGDHPPERIAAAAARLKQMSESDLARLERNLIEWVPAREFVYDRAGFQRALDTYADLTEEGLAEHMTLFLREVAPVAEEAGIRLALHPDDPPFSLFGLPRVVSTLDDLRRIGTIGPNVGHCFCTGSLGARADNDLPAMAAAVASDIHFAHLRNTTRESDGSYHEADHLGGDTDMVAVISALMAEEKRRATEGRADAVIPMRPDHGHALGDDLTKRTNPGYTEVGRLRGLAELRGVMHAVERLRM